MHDRSEFRLNLGRCLTLSGIISEILFAILIQAAASFTVLMLDQSSLPLVSIMILVGIFLFYLLRNLATKLWHLLLPGLILVAGPGFIAAFSPWIRALLVIVMLIVGLRALAQRLRPESNAVQAMPLSGTVIALGWLFFINRISAWQALPEMAAACFYLGVVYLLLVLLRQHHVTLNERLARFVPITSQPTGRIKRFNHRLLAAFLFLAAVLLLLTPWLQLEVLLPWLGAVLLSGAGRVLGWLFSLFQSGEPTEPQPTEPVTEPSNGGWLPGGPDETPAWLLVLQDIVLYALLIGVAAVIVVLVISAVYSFYKKFYEQRRSGPDVLEIILPRFANQIKETVRASRSRLDLKFGTGPEHRIRRYYFKLIENLIRSGREIRPDMTPEQIAALFSSQNPEVPAEITFIYEKARYGSGLCTSEDARRMLILYRLIKNDRGVPKHG